jgi:hypothetical protein
MTDVSIPPLLALFVALLALGVAVALVYLRNFIPRRFRSPIYVGVAVLLAASAALVSRGDQPQDGPGKLAGLFVAFLALVVLAHQLQHWFEATEERKRDATMRKRLENRLAADPEMRKLTVLAAAAFVLAVLCSTPRIFDLFILLVSMGSAYRLGLEARVPRSQGPQEARDPRSQGPQEPGIPRWLFRRGGPTDPRSQG